MTDVIRGHKSVPVVYGALKGLHLGAPSSWDGTNDVYERHLQVGVTKETVEGSPATPCLKLVYPGFWRFRWAVEAGDRTVTVQVKQAANTAPYPLIRIKANPDVGLALDVTTSAGAGSDWKSVSAAFTATAAGAVWVELHYANPTWHEDGSYSCYWDHIVTT